LRQFGTIYLLIIYDIFIKLKKGMIVHPIILKIRRERTEYETMDEGQVPVLCCRCLVGPGVYVTLVFR